MIREMSGITLVALVVTIVVLLILAAVSINLVLGENGIIEKANEAKRKTLNEQVYSEEQMNQLYAEMVKVENSIIRPTEDLDAPIIESVVIPAAQISNKSFTAVVMATDIGSGIKKYEYSNNGGGSWVEGGSSYTFISGIRPNTKYYIRVRVTDGAGNVTYYPSTTTNIEITTKDRAPEMDASGVNIPVLTQDLTPVVYNVSTKTWEKANTSTNSWYSYEAATGTNDSKNSRWANAMTPDGSMWVWIPRFAYKITSNYHTDNHNGLKIDIVFVDKDNNDINGNVYSTSYPSVTGNAMNDYVVHPVFVNNTVNGGWDSELAGIWVAKFEASSKEGNSNTTQGDNVATKTLQVKPGVASWRNIMGGNIFDVCRNATYSAANASSLNSHQMKNTEWGAVAYLAQSKYGRNGNEITINNSSSFITGSAGNSVDAAPDAGITNDYTSSQGELASTTGNMYGIYDMRGCSREYVAAYLSFDGEYGIVGNYSTSLGEAEAKYKNVYEANFSDAYELSSPANGHFGDALWETSASGIGYPHYDAPIFTRDRDSSSLGTIGLFGYSDYDGYYQSTTSFRPVLTIL